MSNIKDVAKQAGVSVTTVSRVMNNSGYISKATRMKVEKAIAEIDYHPNQIARALLKNQSYFLGVIVPDSSHPFFSELIRYVEMYASDQNYKIMICNSLGQSDKEAKYISMLRENRVDGIIMCSHTLDIEKYKKVNLPVVSFDRIISPNIPYVGPDNFRGGELATEHLIRRGCKKLLHLSGALKLDMLSNRRGDAFRLACMKRGIPCHIIEYEPNMLTFEYFTDFIAKEVGGILSEFDGVFCSNDLLAYALYCYTRRHGIKVPEQLKIVGFDYHSFTRMLQNPKLTTIKQPIDLIGKTLSFTIIRMIEGGENDIISNTTVDVELIEGETT